MQKSIFKYIKITTIDITDRHKIPFLDPFKGYKYKAKGRNHVKTIDYNLNILDKDSTEIVIDSIIKIP